MVTEAGDKEARITLNYLEQLRNALGQAIGQQEMQSVWPIRVVVLKPKRQVLPELKFAREGWTCSLEQITPKTTASVVDVLPILARACASEPPPRHGNALFHSGRGHHARDSWQTTRYKGS